jgi:sugar O-acyltransferase (sialic acid O-acetyltransferase NeuD family)
VILAEPVNGNAELTLTTRLQGIELMGMETIFIVGASGHGKVVLDALLQSGLSVENIIVSDDCIELLGKHFLGLPITVPAIQDAALKSRFHVAVGNGVVRRKLFEGLESAGSRPYTVLHPRAVISNFASIGAGVFVAAQGLVAPGATLGRGVIINHGAVVDHDCDVGNFVHIAPNATLGGRVRIGDLALIGAGATILPQTTIGEGAIIGAGAVVVRDVGAGDVCAGVPAVSIERG